MKLLGFGTKLNRMLGITTLSVLSDCKVVWVLLFSLLINILLPVITYAADYSGRNYQWRQSKWEVRADATTGGGKTLTITVPFSENGKMVTQKFTAFSGWGQVEKKYTQVVGSGPAYIPDDTYIEPSFIFSLYMDYQEDGAAKRGNDNRSFMLRFLISNGKTKLDGIYLRSDKNLNDISSSSADTFLFVSSSDHNNKLVATNGTRASGSDTDAVAYFVKSVNANLSALEQFTNINPAPAQIPSGCTTIQPFSASGNWNEFKELGNKAIEVAREDGIQVDSTLLFPNIDNATDLALYRRYYSTMTPGSAGFFSDAHFDYQNFINDYNSLTVAMSAVETIVFKDTGNWSQGTVVDDFFKKLFGSTGDTLKTTAEVTAAGMTIRGLGPKVVKYGSRIGSKLSGSGVLGGAKAASENVARTVFLSDGSMKTQFTQVGSAAAQQAGTAQKALLFGTSGWGAVVTGIGLIYTSAAIAQALKTEIEVSTLKQQNEKMQELMLGIVYAEKHHEFHECVARNSSNANTHFSATEAQVESDQLVLADAKVLEVVAHALGQQAAASDPEDKCKCETATATILNIRRSIQSALCSMICSLSTFAQNSLNDAIETLRGVLGIDKAT